MVAATMPGNSEGSMKLQLTSLNKSSKSDSLISNGRLETNNVFLSREVGNCKKGNWL